MNNSLGVQLQDSDSVNLGSNPGSPASRKACVTGTSSDLGQSEYPAKQEQCAYIGRTRTGTDPRRSQADANFVYVIGRTDLRHGENVGCKVGVSRAPKRRLSTLQIATPDALSLVFHVRPAGKKAFEVEQASLRLLRPLFKLSGEWLSCEPEIAVAVVKSLVAGAPRASITDFLRRAKTCTDDPLGTTAILKSMWVDFPALMPILNKWTWGVWA